MQELQVIQELLSSTVKILATISNSKMQLIITKNRYNRNTYDCISLENSYKIICWYIRVFSVMIAIILVNSYLVFIYFNNRSKNIAQYCKLLAHEICFSNLDVSEGMESVASRLVRRNE